MPRAYGCLLHALVVCAQCFVVPCITSRPREALSELGPSSLCSSLFRQQKHTTAGEVYLQQAQHGLRPGHVHEYLIQSALLAWREISLIQPGLELIHQSCSRQTEPILHLFAPQTSSQRCLVARAILEFPKP